MEVSSTMTASASMGLSSSRAKRLYSEISSPGCAPNSSKRWMVLAGRIVAFSMRLAARPVGAARAVTMPLFSKIVSTWFRIVVLPVPGPPVMTQTGQEAASITARSCSSESISSF